MADRRLTIVVGEDGIITGTGTVFVVGEPNVNGRVYSEKALRNVVDAFSSDRFIPVKMGCKSGAVNLIDSLRSAQLGSRSFLAVVGSANNPRMEGNELKVDILVSAVDACQHVIDMRREGLDLALAASGIGEVDDDGVTILDGYKLTSVCIVLGDVEPNDLDRIYAGEASFSMECLSDGDPVRVEYRASDVSCSTCSDTRRVPGDGYSAFWLDEWAPCPDCSVEPHDAVNPDLLPTRTVESIRGDGCAKMTLDEAIQHADRVRLGTGGCAEDHAQLAEWLRDLQRLRGIVTDFVAVVDQHDIDAAEDEVGRKLSDIAQRVRVVIAQELEGHSGDG